MKKKQWLDRLGGIDPAYIEEADSCRPIPTLTAVVPSPKSARHFRWPALIAACLCVVILLATGVFLLPNPVNDPVAGVAGKNDPPDESTGGGVNLPYSPIFPGAQVGATDYRHIWEKLNSLQIEDDTVSEWEDLPEEDDFLGGAAPDLTLPTYGIGNNTYQEVTDNQVEGVIEADRIKRTSSHIFYMRDQKTSVLEVYSVSGADSHLIGSYPLPEGTFGDFYLSEDGKTVTVFVNQWGWTKIQSLDVSNPAKITVKSQAVVEGRLNTSRLVDGRILLITRCTKRSDPDENDPKTYIPIINDECISPADICVPDSVLNRTYTVMAVLDETNLEVLDRKAFLSYNSELYVTRDRAFLSHPLADGMTEIVGVDFGFDIDPARLGAFGTYTVKGSILNQYSMDLHDGIFRVVTTVGSQQNENASLYCFRLTDGSLVASVENFAPDGESVQSVRFDREKAYVCTAIQMSDPVFYFDLSDLNHITVKDTGTIDGFSSSLIQYGQGYLLGAGMDAKRNFKIEMYKEADEQVKSVAVYSGEGFTRSAMPSEYKSYLIDREKGLFGFNYYGYTGSDRVYRYVLLRFDRETETFCEVLVQPLEDYGDGGARAVLIDGYLYIFSGKQEFHVVSVKV